MSEDLALQTRVLHAADELNQISVVILRSNSPSWARHYIRLSFTHVTVIRLTGKSKRLWLRSKAVKQRW